MTQDAVFAPAYNPTLDYLRFLAALVIVLFHAGMAPGGTDIVGVGIFIIVMVYLLGESVLRQPPDMTRYIRQRARRLIWPLLIWGGLHVTAKSASVGFQPQAMRAELAGWLPPAGTMAQLWFLPWAFVVGTVLALAGRRGLFDMRFSQPGAALSMCLIAGGLASLPLMLWTWGDLPSFYRNCTLYLSSVATGLALFWLRDRPALAWAAAAIFAGIGLGLGLLGVEKTEQIVLPPLICMAALSITLPGPQLAKYLGVLSMLIYLDHILVLAVSVNVLKLDATTWAGVGIVMALSIALAVAIRHMRLDRWLG